MAPPIRTWTRDSYLISSDPSLLSLPSLAMMLDDPKWEGRKDYPLELLEAMITNSFCLGLYKPTQGVHCIEAAGLQQIGFARLITDHATLAIIADVVVVEAEQGKGLGKWLLECINEVVQEMDPSLRRVILFCHAGTLDSFYEKQLEMKRWGGVSEGGLVMMHREGSKSGVIQQAENE